MAKNATRKLFAQLLHVLEEERKAAVMPDARHLSVSITHLEDAQLRYNSLAVQRTPPQREPPRLAAVTEVVMKL